MTSIIQIVHDDLNLMILHAQTLPFAGRNGIQIKTEHGSMELFPFNEGFILIGALMTYCITVMCIRFPEGVRFYGFKIPYPVFIFFKSRRVLRTGYGFEKIRYNK